MNLQFLCKSEKMTILYNFVIINVLMYCCADISKKIKKKTNFGCRRIFKPERKSIGGDYSWEEGVY